VIPAAYWLANSATSKWIAPAADENYPSLGTPHPGGDYIYRISFDLTGFDFNTVSISGTWGVDNAGTIRLNGVYTGSNTTSYNPLVPFSLSSGFHAGINDLDFVINNYAAGGSNPTGVRVDELSGAGTATASVGAGLEGQALALSVPFPNPTRGLARFHYTLPRAGMVRPKLRYAHQGGMNPPVIVIHGSALGAIPQTYRRFLEHFFVDVFQLQGTPLRIQFKTGANPYAESAARRKPRRSK